jgi:pantetheine-phosphate adenylyltransferase
MRRIALYPGSFDPITRGHTDIIKRMAPLFDKLIVLISQSAEKRPLFNLDERRELAEVVLKKISNVEVDSNPGLTVSYMKKSKAAFIVRGLRSEADLNHEWVVANMNKDLYSKAETLLVFGRPEMSHISSRAVKEVALYGGDPSAWVEPIVAKALMQKIKAMKGIK